MPTLWVAILREGEKVVVRAAEVPLTREPVTAWLMAYAAVRGSWGVTRFAYEFARSLSAIEFAHARTS